MPLLREAFDGKTSFPDHPEYNVANMGNATSIRLIVSNYFPVMHNMHLHGKSNFWVLAEGTGEWDGVITNPENPQRRDGQQLGPGTPDNPTFIVIQWEVDNPGVWPFHCHLVVHASAGLYMNIIVSFQMLRIPIQGMFSPITATILTRMYLIYSRNDLILLQMQRYQKLRNRLANLGTLSRQTMIFVRLILG